MTLLFPTAVLNNLLPLLAAIAGIFVISTKNAIISVFNLIVLYILVAFYLIYIGMAYLGLSYIIIYIGAIAILFLFIIMMIDIEVVEKRSNNYLPLLFLLLSGFLFTLKNILYNIGLIKMKSIKFKEESVFIDNIYEKLFYINNVNNNFYEEDKDEISKDNFFNVDKDRDHPLHFIMNKLYDKNEGDFHYNLSSNTSPEKINTLIKYNESKKINEKSIYIDILSPSVNYTAELRNNYLLVTPSWDFAINRITQITAIGDVLYTIYHTYIYILSIILLLSMVGAIILTGDISQEIRIIKMLGSKKSGILSPYFIINIWKQGLLFSNNIWDINKKNIYNIYINIKMFIWKKKSVNYFNFNTMIKKNMIIPPFFYTFNNEYLHSEDILGNLIYFILANILIGLLLLGINSYLSLSVKYLEKGGGFECGFTSFVQTRERFNIIFYRVSLLFLVFDLEIILAFPYTAIYQKNQNISKNNILAFLYILIVGFIYELKEGALNIVKKAHLTEINISNK